MGYNMKKIFTLLLLAVSFGASSQISNRILKGQNYLQDIDPDNVVFTIPPDDNRFFVARKTALRFNFNQVLGLLDSVKVYSDTRYKAIGWLPTWSDVSGKPTFATVATTGAYSSLSGLPVIPSVTSQLTNNSGFISVESDPVWSGVAANYRTKLQNDLLYKSIGYTPTNTEIVSAIGYTPYNASNPNNYITLSQVPADAVSSVNGKTGVVVVNKADVGLSNVDNTSDANKPISAAVQTALNGKQPTGNYLTGITASQVNTALGYTAYNGSANPNGYLNQASVRTSISLTTNGSSGVATYDNTTGILNVPNYTGQSRSFNNTAVRAINGAGVQLSSTRDVIVSYSVTHTIALTLLLSSGSSQVFLEISPNNTTWTSISQAGYSDAVAVAVSLNKTTTSNVQGVVPAGFFVRLRAVTSGAGSATYVSGQEVML